MCLSVCLVCLSLCLLVHFSTCLSTYLSNGILSVTCLCVCRSCLFTLSVYLSSDLVCLHVCLPVYMSACLPVCLPVCLSVYVPQPRLLTLKLQPDPILSGTTHWQEDRPQSPGRHRLLLREAYLCGRERFSTNITALLAEHLHWHSCDQVNANVFANPLA